MSWNLKNQTGLRDWMRTRMYIRNVILVFAHSDGVKTNLTNIAGMIVVVPFARQIRRAVVKWVMLYRRINDNPKRTLLLTHTRALALLTHLLDEIDRLNPALKNE